jgi:hypothetical protein
MRVGYVFKDAEVVGIDDLRAAREAMVVRDIDNDGRKTPPGSSPAVRTSTYWPHEDKPRNAQCCFRH